MSPDPSSGRDGSGRLAENWAAKAEFLPRTTPLHRRRWLRRLLFGLFCAAGLAAAATIAFFSNWRDQQLTELKNERRCLASFLQSPEFALFEKAMDDQFVALVNYISARPQEARAAIPGVAKSEEAAHAMPWTLDVMPLPVTAGSRPARVAAAVHDVCARLAQHGLAFGDAERNSSRLLFLRLLQPYVRAYRQRAPADSFNAIAIDVSMQETALASLAAHFGSASGIVEVEHMLNLYGQVGPSMWRAIEHDRTGQAPDAFGPHR